jgi:hypothetical protein
VSEAGVSDEPPSADLMAEEAKATHELTKARRKLLDAMNVATKQHLSV